MEIFFWPVLIMTKINLSELQEFKKNYLKEITDISNNLNTINRELNKLKEFINTPNIGKKIEEFNNYYNEYKDLIKNNTEALDINIGNIIGVYQELYNNLNKGVGYDK